MSGVDLAPVVAAAERALSRQRSRNVRLGDVERLSEDDRRNLLLRCRDLDGGPRATVIIKKVVADAYNPDDICSWDTTRFFSDWTGAEFLSAVLPVPRSPLYYGGDRELGLFVLEDLGVHRSLVEPLLDGDAASAESALLAFSSCLGSVHAGTAGHSATFEALMRGRNAEARSFAPPLTGLGERFHMLRAALEGLGITCRTDFLSEVALVSAAVETPGPFLSYVHGDPCPDNVFWNGSELRLIDFEFGGLGHALADAAYGRMMFPSCWCAHRVPTDLMVKMEAAYRTELVKGCPEAQDDRTFEHALTVVCGFWLLSSLSRQLAGAIEADRTWGIATIRQRVLARLEAFIETAEEFHQLPAIRGTASTLLERLRTAWRDVVPLPVYPAFQRVS